MPNDLATVLARYGLSPDTMTPQTIRTGDRPGGFILSADPEASHLPPTLVEVRDIAHLKELGGTPDESYASGGRQDEIPYPPPLSDSARRALESAADRRELGRSLTAADRHDLAQAAQAYVHGDSRKVRDYEPLINARYFPRRLAVFAAENVTVQEGSPLTFVRSSPSALVANSITVEPGGQIRVQEHAIITTPAFTVQASTSTAPVINVAPANGNPGTQGGNGNAGSAGGQGSPGASTQDSKSGTWSCTTTPGNGLTGTNGSPGVAGGAGTAGATLSTTLNLGVVSGPLTIYTSGGAGGAGGNGGNGGAGGAGGAAGTAATGCSTASQGVGGAGGAGGNGGQGGAGGSGGTVVVNYSGTAPVTVTNPSLGGLGGQPGQGGAPGAGPSSGGYGANGQPGNNGANGPVGSVILNLQSS